MVLKLLREDDEEYSKRYLKNRIANFRREFLKQNAIDFDDLDMILACVEDYLIGCEESYAKGNCIIRIGEARFWLSQYEDEDH